MCIFIELCCIFSLSSIFVLCACMCMGVCVRACACSSIVNAGNSHNLFSIDRQTGLVTRGLRVLDRETSSSHVLEVEAFNSDEGSMRSSVRVRGQREKQGMVTNVVAKNFLLKSSVTLIKIKSLLFKC